MQYIIAPIFFLIALGGMLAALKFSKYKQGQSACCGGQGCTHDALLLKKKKCNKAEVDIIKTEMYLN